MLAALAFKRKAVPQTVLAQIRAYLSRPYLNFRRPQADLKQAQRNAETSWQTVCRLLPELEAGFWRIHPDLNGNSYRKTASATFLKNWHKIRRRTTALYGQRHARQTLETCVRQTRSRTEKAKRPMRQYLPNCRNWQTSGVIWTHSKKRKKQQ